MFDRIAIVEWRSMKEREKQRCTRMFSSVIHLNRKNCFSLSRFSSGNEHAIANSNANHKNRLNKELTQKPYTSNDFDVRQKTKGKI